MKALLYVFLSLFFLSLMTGCDVASYYHTAPVSYYGKVYGNVKKLTDTLYQVDSMNELCLYQVNECSFDTLHRLSEERLTVYAPVLAEGANRMDSLQVVQTITKYRYDMDGRKVWEQSSTTAITGDTVGRSWFEMTMIRRKENREQWAVKLRETGSDAPVHTVIERQHTKSSLICVGSGNMPDRHYQDIGNITTVYSYDENENPVGLEINVGGVVYSHTCSYDDNHQLMSRNTILADGKPEKKMYCYDEFDNQGNWAKQYVTNDEDKLVSVVHRRIEYR